MSGQNNLDRYPEHRHDSAEFTHDTAIDFHKSDARLLSPEAARALLLLQDAKEVYGGKEKSQVQLIAEYAIASGLNLNASRVAEQYPPKAA